MICFADNDIILKLAACDLLEETLVAIGVQKRDVRVLPTATHFIRKMHRKLVPNYTAEGVSRALEFVQKSDPVDPPDPQEQILLNDVEAIDSGELILFAATKGRTDFLLLTSDKRSLRALSEAKTCTAINERLKGRIICFEQLVQCVVRHCGFHRVLGKVVPAIECDTALRAIFGSGLDSMEEHVETGLVSYVDELRLTTGALLIAEEVLVSIIRCVSD